MASLLDSFFRLAFKRKPREGRAPDEETIIAATNARRASAAVSSTFDPNLSQLPSGTPRSFLIPTDDPLTLYRLMLGITNAAQLGFTESSVVGRRPAANIGLYARVVHAEQKSEDGFKVFSILINACYFLQIVLAAALTAMSAAAIGNGAITAFGAMNTIMAGFLTFLKGSGLPGRLKYYSNEWKKIREFIEQRERDFAREGCTLDVYEVVDTIEKMYTHTKQDIEANTPDTYTSVSGTRQRVQEKEKTIGGFDVSQLDSLASKLKGIDGVVGKIASGIEQRTKGVTDNIHAHEKEIESDLRGLEKAVIRDVEDHKAQLDREAREHRDQAERALEGGAQAVDDSRLRAIEKGEQMLQRAKELPDRAGDEAWAAAVREMRNAADLLERRTSTKS
jgi:hypothetical protein